MADKASLEFDIYHGIGTIKKALMVIEELDRRLAAGEQPTSWDSVTVLKAGFELRRAAGSILIVGDTIEKATRNGDTFGYEPGEVFHRG